MNLREKLAMVDLPITAEELGEAIGEIALQGILRRGARIALQEARKRLHMPHINVIELDKMLKELE